MSNKEILRVENVTKRYRKQVALDNISFSMKQGEIIGLVGPNGAGKSTIMSILCRLIINYEGNVFIENINIRNKRINNVKEIGSLIETPGFYPNLTGYENLKFFSELSENKSKDSIEKIVEMLGLSNVMNKKVKKYSLGMKQRLGIAQAVLGDPKILILDEPTNGLDPNVIPEIRKFIKYIAAERNISVLISSHILTEIEAICEKVLFIKNGKIIEEVSVNEKDKNQSNIFLFRTNDLERLRQYFIQNNIEIDIIDKESIKASIENRKLEDVISNIVKAGISIRGVQEYKLTLEEKFLETMEGNSIV